jgi:uncharacterized protein YuzE
MKIINFGNLQISISEDSGLGYILINPKYKNIDRWVKRSECIDNIVLDYDEHGKIGGIELLMDCGDNITQVRVLELEE